MVAEHVKPNRLAPPHTVVFQLSHQAMPSSLAGALGSFSCAISMPRSCNEGA